MSYQTLQDSTAVSSKRALDQLIKILSDRLRAEWWPIPQITTLSQELSEAITDPDGKELVSTLAPFEKRSGTCASLS